ncbi:hypothetical protein ACFOWE_33265 [Planomonospora corallina]|uniref:Translation initiation factor IF-2 n=1 Tax=Planomonospora corallina TaxID=1806052 RepID=A0ABV8IJ11_9ACTN
MTRGEGLVRSGRRRGGHRRKRARSRAFELYVGAAALAVAAAGVAGITAMGARSGAERAPAARAAGPVGAGMPEAAPLLREGAPGTAPSPPPEGGRRSPMVTAEFDGTGSGARRTPAPGGSGARETTGSARQGRTGRSGAAEPGAAAPGAGRDTGDGPGVVGPVTGPGTGASGDEETGASGDEKETGASGGGEKETGEKETRASGRSRYTDGRAIAYFQRSGAMDRVKDIRTTGGYLRIYTDLPESADDSRQALRLCETGLDYLTEELGEENPVVFVQGRFGENGNPVLANVLGPDDSSCRVTHPEPGG